MRQHKKKPHCNLLTGVSSQPHAARRGLLYKEHVVWGCIPVAGVLLLQRKYSHTEGVI